MPLLPSSSRIAPLVSDAPLRLPQASAPRHDMRREASRQLHASLWLIGVMGLAMAAIVAARPGPLDTNALASARVIAGQVLAAATPATPTAVR